MWPSNFIWAPTLLFVYLETVGGTVIDGSLFSLMAIDLAAMLILLVHLRPGLTTTAPI